MTAEASSGSDLGGMIDTDFSMYSISGSLDSQNTELANYSDDSSTFGYSDPGNYYAEETSQCSFSAEDIPFKSESDTDVVFEARSSIIKMANYEASYTGQGFFSYTEAVKFNQVFSIIIRFHK